MRHIREPLSAFEALNIDKLLPQLFIKLDIACVFIFISLHMTY